MIRYLLYTCAALLIFISLAFGLPGVTEKQVVWDANTEEDLAGYRLYYRAEIEIYSDARYYLIPVGTENYSTKDMPFDTYLVLTAFDNDGNESEFSNEVLYLPFDQVAPATPSGVRVIRIE